MTEWGRWCHQRRVVHPGASASGGGMNWRKKKKLWKRTNGWMRRNGSNKSLHTYCRINGIRRWAWWLVE